MPWGSPSMNTRLTPVFIGVVPQTPCYGGRPIDGWGVTIRRSENMTMRPSCLGDTGPY